MPSHIRKHRLVNINVQGTLILRTTGYGIACLAFVIVGATLLRTWHAPDRLIFHHLIDVLVAYSGVLAAFAVVLPFVFFDMLKMSHRIAGPLLRLEREMSRFADGETVEPLKFRDDDYWSELATEFNRIVATREVRTRITTDQLESAGLSMTSSDGRRFKQPLYAVAHADG